MRDSIAVFSSVLSGIENLRNTEEAHNPLVGAIVYRGVIITLYYTGWCRQNVTFLCFLHWFFVSFDFVSLLTFDHLYAVVRFIPNSSNPLM